MRRKSTFSFAHYGHFYDPENTLQPQPVTRIMQRTNKGNVFTGRPKLHRIEFNAFTNLYDCDNIPSYFETSP